MLVLCPMCHGRARCFFDDIIYCDILRCPVCGFTAYGSDALKIASGEYDKEVRSLAR